MTTCTQTLGEFPKVDCWVKASLHNSLSRKLKVLGGAIDSGIPSSVSGVIHFRDIQDKFMLEEWWKAVVNTGRNYFYIETMFFGKIRRLLVSFPNNFTDSFNDHGLEVPVRFLVVNESIYEAVVDSHYVFELNCDGTVLCDDILICR